MDLESHLGSEDKLLCDLGQVSRPLDLSFLTYRIYIEMTAATPEGDWNNAMAYVM